MNKMQIFAKALLEQIEVARVRQLSGLQESYNAKHADTARAISIFQKYAGLDQTGLPDPKTMSTIKMVAERVNAEWVQVNNKAKELLAQGMTPDQVGQQLGVQGPNNGITGSMGGLWGAINAAQQAQTAKAQPLTGSTNGAGNGDPFAASASNSTAAAPPALQQYQNRPAAPAAPAAPAGDGGADPYVSNGQSTVAPPTTQLSQSQQNLINAGMGGEEMRTDAEKAMSAGMADAPSNPNAGLTPDDPRWKGPKPAPAAQSTASPDRETLGTPTIVPRVPPKPPVSTQTAPSSAQGPATDTAAALGGQSFKDASKKANAAAATIANNSEYEVAKAQGQDPTDPNLGKPAPAAGPTNRDSMPFGKAFADAKAKGEKQFMWKGKPYAVAMKGASPATAQTAPQTKTGTGASGFPMTASPGITGSAALNPANGSAATTIPSGQAAGGPGTQPLPSKPMQSGSLPPPKASAVKEDAELTAMLRIAGLR
jgi:hypothetical protein